MKDNKEEEYSLNMEDIECKITPAISHSSALPCSVTDGYISYGGGVNSVALTIQEYEAGRLYPLIFADTGSEMPETYCYMDYFEKEYLLRYGMKITKISPKTHAELYCKRAKGGSLEEVCLDKKIIPFGMRRFCTGEWKHQPVQKLMKGKTALIGFAMDESGRAKNPDLKYPLIENGVTREGCKNIIKNAGLKVPVKSGCYFCPFQRIRSWENLWREYPELWQRAIKLEDNARERYENVTIMPSGMTLRNLEAVFESKGGDLFPDYDFEELTPCMCIT